MAFCTPAEVEIGRGAEMDDAGQPLPQPGEETWESRAFYGKLPAMARGIARAPAFAVFLATSGAHAAEIAAKTCSRDEVQAAVDQAVDGDTVRIPPGTCAWSSEVAWLNKNIRVLGAGIDQTKLEGDGTKFRVGAHQKAGFRISGMTLSGTSPESVFSFKNDTNTPTAGFRVDHIKFVYSGDTATDFFYVVGLVYGVIDHCSVQAPGGIFVQHYAYTEQEGDYAGTTSWSLPLDLGGDSAIYVEDCTVSYGAGWFPGMNDSWSGGRLVFRYNQLSRPVFQTHGARGKIRGGLKLEIYGNTMVSDGVAWDRVAQIRSGTGVIFNNQIAGYQYPKATLDVPRVCDTGPSDFGGWCDGTSPWDGNSGSSQTKDAGWPCLDMPGRGTTSASLPGATQPSEPYYAWRNGPEKTCTTSDGPCTVQEVFECSWGYEKCDPGPPSTCDYVRVSPAQSPHTGGVFDAHNSSTPKPGYAPFTYPHPIIADCAKHPITCDPPGAGGAGGASGTGGGGGASGAAGGGEKESDEGCGCRSAGGSGSRSAMLLFGWMLGVALMRRRS